MDGFWIREGCERVYTRYIDGTVDRYEPIYASEGMRGDIV
jgi:hypothetical protein